VRKYLGALALLAALCTSSWAQDPAPVPTPATPPAPAQPATPDQTPAAEPTKTAPTSSRPVAAAIEFPRFEFFLGGSYAEAGPFNAGHWAGLYGWDSSLAFNATHWLGFVVDGGQYFGTSKIPVSVPTPFPTCPPLCPTSSPTFNVDTREYNFLFGPQFSRRKSQSWTLFGELLIGRAGIRGHASEQGFGYNAVSSGYAVVAGGGADHRINRRVNLRLKADYLETRAFKQKQDNFRFSVGVGIHSIRKKKRTLEEDTAPE
jgi:hypothetical protein